jgi:tetratricopeptide (TPR) repeat protein
LSFLGLRTSAAAAVLGLAVGTVAVPASAAHAADRRVEIGDPIEDVELRTIEGKRERLLSRGAAANVFIFFRPEQERSLETLKEMAGCEKEFAARPVRWVGIVSDAFAAEEVKAVVKDAGVRMPVLVDEGDALYGKLGIRLHPVIGMVDRKGRLAAFEPFRQINYCERIRVRIKLLLGEATEADVARADEPERATTRTESGVARRHVNFARTLVRIAQHAKALEEIDRSLAIAPSAPAYALRGEILASQGRCPDALRAFEQALELEPGNTVAQDGRRTCGK